MTEPKNFGHNTAPAAQDDSGVVVSCGELQLLQAELNEVTDALLNLAGRIHEAAGFIADHADANQLLRNRGMTYEQ